MSKLTYSTNKNYNQHSSSRYSNESSYVSSLERLDQLTDRYQPKKFLENNDYKKLYHEGKCDLFETSSSNYRYYFIHRETPTDILNELINMLW